MATIGRITRSRTKMEPTGATDLSRIVLIHLLGELGFLIITHQQIAMPVSALTSRASQICASVLG